ncbi:hypothetical protein BDU57DRAFT_65699 [Ampelomyces quisqualis]|uniref:Uncharacterized protein n=1 Tax=Ampelomyces quisqualis TaxID=50730 RepID=A0A6A5R1I2_AMPQU|nr:hypothetical protein BDU57DRAFT_65699 [Ampelomyces quisqualis]
MSHGVRGESGAAARACWPSLTISSHVTAGALSCCQWSLCSAACLVQPHGLVQRRCRAPCSWSPAAAAHLRLTTRAPRLRLLVCAPCHPAPGTRDTLERPFPLGCRPAVSGAETSRRAPPLGPTWRPRSPSRNEPSHEPRVQTTCAWIEFVLVFASILMSRRSVSRRMAVCPCPGRNWLLHVHNN